MIKTSHLQPINKWEGHVATSGTGLHEGPLRHVTEETHQTITKITKGSLLPVSFSQPSSHSHKPMNQTHIAHHPNTVLYYSERAWEKMRGSGEVAVSWINWYVACFLFLGFFFAWFVGCFCLILCCLVAGKVVGKGKRIGVWNNPLESQLRCDAFGVQVHKQRTKLASISSQTRRPNIRVKVGENGRSEGKLGVCSSWLNWYNLFWGFSF